MELNRASCSLINGTTYLSSTERNWFTANCIAATARPRTAPLAAARPVEAIPAPAAAAPVVREVAPATSVIDRFIAGYRAAGGPEAHLNRIVTRVIPCESGGNTHAVNRGGPYYGLMQFMGATWNAVGGGDWFDPYQQGANTARLVVRANPATQWPVCWFA